MFSERVRQSLERFNERLNVDYPHFFTLSNCAEHHPLFPLAVRVGIWHAIGLLALRLAQQENSDTIFTWDEFTMCLREHVMPRHEENDTAIAFSIVKEFQEWLDQRGEDGFLTLQWKITSCDGGFQLRQYREPFRLVE